MGRKAKPTQQHLAEGDPGHKGGRKLNQALASEPKAQNGFGKCSPRLRGDARKAWCDLTRQLELMDLDKRPDTYALERVCAALATIWEADDHITREGAVVRI